MIKAVDDESSVASITAVVNADGERFLFDQSAQHALFWDAVNTKDWDAMDSLLDDKVVRFLNLCMQFLSSHTVLVVRNVPPR